MIAKSLAALSRRWAELLVSVLAGIYLFLGLAARGPLGLSAVLGAGAMGAGLWQAPRSRPLATALLVAGTVPFAVAAWWSVAAPLAGTLALAIGVPHVWGTPIGGGARRSARKRRLTTGPPALVRPSVGTDPAGG